MPKERARWATRAPTRPRPTTPSVLPCSSTPSQRVRSHLPAFSAASAWGMLRAWASNSATVCSAADRMLDCGALTTITPRRVAAPTSTLSTPMPARPTTIRSSAASSTGSVTLVAERMISASAPGTAPRSSSGESPRRTSTWWPASRRRARPPSAISSVTRIRPIDLRPSAKQLGDAVETFFQVVVAEGVGQAHVAGRTEGLTGHDGDTSLFEDDLGQLDGGLRSARPELLAQRPLERGEGVEGAVGFDTGHAGDGAQQLD